MTAIGLDDFISDSLVRVDANKSAGSDSMVIDDTGDRECSELWVDVGVIAWVCWFAEGDPLQDLGVSMRQFLTSCALSRLLIE